MLVGFFVFVWINANWQNRGVGGFFEILVYFCSLLWITRGRIPETFGLQKTTNITSLPKTPKILVAQKKRTERNPQSGWQSPLSQKMTLFGHLFGTFWLPNWSQFWSKF